jgi:hypothetical protein
MARKASKPKTPKLRLDRDEACRLIRSLWNGEGNVLVNREWVDKIERLSQMCVDTLGKTHIAMLGTAILAKALAPEVDLYAFKPNHARDFPNAYSARSLCHGVLVLLAAELRFHLGATGREPLNNQPYFRMKRLDDGTPIHSRSRAAFEYMMSLIKELSSINSQVTLAGILLAFLQVRANYQPKYAAIEGKRSISREQLIQTIDTFVRDNSDNGKRAQAVVAGLFDVFAGPENVESGKINDPSRHYPGDVCVRAPPVEDAVEPEVWIKALEVRDKPVSMSEVMIFGNRCADLGVREAAVVMIGVQQQPIDEQALMKWSAEAGLGLTLFRDWSSLVSQVLYWCDAPTPAAAVQALGFIYQRLIDIEASAEALALWERLTFIDAAEGKGMIGSK